MCFCGCPCSAVDAFGPPYDDDAWGACSCANAVINGAEWPQSFVVLSYYFSAYSADVTQAIVFIRFIFKYDNFSI